MWTIRSARPLLRLLEAALAPGGWHVALAGGVLHRGTSSNDLDVVLIPRTTRVIDWAARDAALAGCGLTRTRGAGEMRAIWEKKGSFDAKHVEVFRDARDRRVDVITMTE